MIHQFSHQIVFYISYCRFLVIKIHNSGSYANYRIKIPMNFRGKESSEDTFLA